MRGMSVIDSAGRVSRRIQRWEIRDLFSGNRPPGHVLTGLQLHYLPLSSSSYFLLFTSTVTFIVYFWFYFFCVWGG